MDRDTAALLNAVSWTDGGEMFYIGYNPGTAPADKISGTDPQYYANMEYDVGFSGRLVITDGDNFASVKIGLNGAKALTGTYDSFVLPIANDDQQIWEYKLYVDPTGGSYYESPSWTALAGGTQATLTLPFGAGVDFSTLGDIGYMVQFNKATTGGGTNTSDDFHTSVVPVPGAALLSLLGVSLMGLARRRFQGA